MAARLRAIERGDGDYEQALQQFLGQSPWDDQAAPRRPARLGRPPVRRGRVPDHRRRRVPQAGRALRRGGPAVHRDARQGGEPPGRGDAPARRGGRVAALDARSYLPRAWTGDRERMARAGVPGGVGYQPKWQAALAMLRRADASGPRGRVPADGGFGTATAFRGQLGSGRAGVLRRHRPDAEGGRGRRRPRPGAAVRRRRRTAARPAKVRAGATSPSVKGWAVDHSGDFRTVKWREGSRGRMAGRLAAWRVRPAHKLSAGREPLAACWLLAEWPEGADAPTRYSSSNRPTGGGGVPHEKWTRS